MGPNLWQQNLKIMVLDEVFLQDKLVIESIVNDGDVSDASRSVLQDRLVRREHIF